MRKPRRLRSQSFENQQVLERIGEVILSANDVADPQIRVIDARCQVICRHSVRPQQCEILHLVRCLRLRAIHAIDKP